MRRDDVEWISGQFLCTDVTFPNNTTWQLTDVMTEKSTFFDEGPAEASAVFPCVETGGSKPVDKAIMRIRMQHDVARLYY